MAADGQTYNGPSSASDCTSHGSCRAISVLHLPPGDSTHRSARQGVQEEGFLARKVLAYEADLVTLEKSSLGTLLGDFGLLPHPAPFIISHI